MNTYKAIKNGAVPYVANATAPRRTNPEPADPAAEEAYAAHRQYLSKETELEQMRMAHIEDQLVKLGKRVEYSQFSAAADPLAHFYDGDDYMAEDEELLWLVEGYIPMGYLAVLGGGSKSGKSCLVTDLAIAVANGEPFLGMPTRQGPVLWFACEESRAERRAALLNWPEIPKGLKTTHCRLRIDAWRDLRDLKSCVLRTGAVLVVIDSLFAATGASLADGRSARDAIMGIKQIAAETLATFIVIHHINKESGGLHRDRFAESNQILAAASMDILFDANAKDGCREIRLSSRGRGEWTNRELRIRSESVSHYELVASGNETATTSNLRAEAIRSALAAHEDPLSAEELAAFCGSPITTTRNRLTMMVREGLIYVAGKRGRAQLFALCELPK